ncbi:hypothetical protein [Thalassobaculum litoreum]|uniref:Uncharacterized protein n=1 Tax=Thalassobaculum litoreum DSM 18839 TaxID=1123362 RepID=A0A8G2F1M0_9PROT|nr:hypothetical protein [Thalassobaculum litoreum]SDF22993.1 hypothetical protein SAMN05660686_00652 [Thalassobaculum litoreum DSM 18839]
MSSLQITLAVVFLVAAVLAAGLASWGISGLFPGGSKKASADPAEPEDYATRLERKNLAAKRTHNGD